MIFLRWLCWHRFLLDKVVKFWVAWIAFGLSWFEAWTHWKFNWVFICCGFKLYSAHRFPCAWQNANFSLRIGGHKCFVKLRWTCLLLTSGSLPRWGVAVGSWWLHFWKLQMFLMNLELQKRFQQHLWSRSMWHKLKFLRCAWVSYIFACALSRVICVYIYICKYIYCIYMYTYLSYLFINTHTCVCV